MTSTSTPASRMPRVVVLAAVVAVLAIVAAVIAIADGNWLLGIPFVLLAAVDGNIAWFYLHRARRVASAETAA